MANLITKVQENSRKPAPRWFRKAKKAIGILTIAANAMVAQMTFKDPKTALMIQLWCTIGVGAILEALDIMLANGEEYTSEKDETVLQESKTDQ